MPHLMPQVSLNTVKMTGFASTLMSCNYFIILVFFNLIACTVVQFI